MEVKIMNSDNTNKIEETRQDDIFTCVQKAIADNPKDMLADEIFANVVRDHLTNHPKEYTQLLKQYKNDFNNMCCDLTLKLNAFLCECVVPNAEYTQLEKEVKNLTTQAKKMIEQNVPLTDKELMAIQADILKKQTKLSRMATIETKDLSYKASFLSGLINKVRTQLADITPESEPSDIDARKQLKFEKTMSLEQSLFTLLWNTRSQTIPLSVLNIKAWSARLVQRMIEGEGKRSNQPTALFLRSREDNGRRTGGSGKSNIAFCLCELLKRKSLNISNGDVEIPTNERIDKKMSDKSLIWFDDMRFDDVPWETLNKFLDGLPIKNRGKYQKEGNIFGFGNIIGTTNYDLPYTNDFRYPVIEFSKNRADVAGENELVKALDMKTYVINGVSSNYVNLEAAWETLLAYASEHYNEWLGEYKSSRVMIASNCSRQRTKLENLIIGFVDEKMEMNIDTFSPSSVLNYIRENYASEFRKVSISSVVDGLRSLGIEQANDTMNEYKMNFKTPDHSLDYTVVDNPIEAIHNWIFANASKPVNEQGFDSDKIQPTKKESNDESETIINSSLSNAAIEDLRKHRNDYSDIFATKSIMKEVR